MLWPLNVPWTANAWAVTGPVRVIVVLSVPDSTRLTEITPLEFWLKVAVAVSVAPPGSINGPEYVPDNLGTTVPVIVPLSVQMDPDWAVKVPIIDCPSPLSDAVTSKRFPAWW